MVLGLGNMQLEKVFPIKSEQLDENLMQKFY